MEMAAARAPVSEREEVGLLLAADLFRQATPGLEHTARQVAPRPRKEAGDRVERGLVLADASARDGAEEADGVRVARVVEDLLGGAFLDQATRVEHADSLAHLRDDGEVVTDEEDARPEFLPE